MSSQTLILGAALAPAPSPSRSRSRCLRIRAQVDSSDKSVEVMRKFSEQYARRSGTYFCVDKGVTSVVIKGLAEHKDSIGAPLCPCIMMTRLPRQGKDFGTVHVYPCGKGRSATVCFFSLPKMILPGRNRPSPWKRSKRRRQNSEVVASFVNLPSEVSP